MSLCVCVYTHMHTGTCKMKQSLDEAIQHVSGPEEWLGLVESGEKNKS